MNKEQGVDFLQTQNCVLTEDSAAVTCENGSDAHFGNENQITFEKIRILGTGGSAQVEEYVAMIISPVAKCDLLKFMEEVAPTPDFLRLLRTFPGCLVTALEYLHHEGIRHKDIKPSNILVNGCNVLFTDFGISRDGDNTRATTSDNPRVFTLRYSAPEAAERSFPSNWWSVGCVFLEIFTIVRGEPLSKLCSFFQNNGTKMKAYCQNQKAISG
ncbi:hypothetical protein HBI81_215510 [Parastagonospora nodorum]|nr:hypothetical protein HBH51_213990 [Parastagonospora nodorum]KAH4082290.1 hypothetical protein HBH46_221540 [Parastagonospora nodorum]KAH4182708.1 hypothetical protein HBH42_216890 [Parastagonospora nodorum]KAH4252561.1 hypothetical protein HBI03_207860 [Parastagonospora nodorum]KAH4260732.1 hypothetical protein HBI04_208190 [Parastagonospora nodorum]